MGEAGAEGRFGIYSWCFTITKSGSVSGSFNSMLESKVEPAEFLVQFKHMLKTVTILSRPFDIWIRKNR